MVHEKNIYKPIKSKLIEVIEESPLIKDFCAYPGGGVLIQDRPVH